MEIHKLHGVFLAHPIVSIDSRVIKEGSIFFALSGENFNGNDFALEALSKGASYAVVSDKSLLENSKIIVVPDVLKCLQSLATYHRKYANAKIISLTGSNGKTTTKELIFRVLSKKYKTIATHGNLNNHIGVPLSLLQIKSETEFAIIEMGANHQREIASLCEIAQPDFGCITNFGKAHIEGFGGVEGVIKGKSELYNYLIENNKIILYNDQDRIQEEKTSGYPHAISFGQKPTAKFKTSTIFSDHANVSFKFQGSIIETKLYGDYNASNCMIAAAIGAYFKVPHSDINHAISNYQPNNNRSELKKIGLHHVIMDAYNANPSSMTAALKHFNKLATNLPKIVILGDMFELGDSAIEEHQTIVNLLETLSITRVILIGRLFNKTRHSYESYTSFKELTHDKMQCETSMILIKGSRGMALERIIPLLES